MENRVLDVIKRRRSVREFLPQPIEHDKLAAIAEAGLYAPNAGGQSWHFSVVCDQELLTSINDLAKQVAMTTELPWMKSLGSDETFHCLYRAPAVIFVSADEQGIAPEVDTAAATQNLLLAAESLEVGSCWGYFATQAFLSDAGDALRRKLSIPDGYKVYTSVMLGYPSGQRPIAPPREEGLVTYVG